MTNGDAREAFLLLLLPNVKHLLIYVRLKPLLYLQKLLASAYLGIRFSVKFTDRRRYLLNELTNISISTSDVLKADYVVPFLTLASLNYFRAD
jgi:hypothetical protein